MNLVLAWQGPEPWYLVTNLDDPREVLRIYRCHMAIEEFFRDYKRELGLRQAQVRQAHRLNGLLLALLVAYLLLALLGLSRRLSASKRLVLAHGQASFSWLALQWLKRLPPNASKLLYHALDVQSG